MPNPFQSEALRIAHYEIMRHRRRYLDWDKFMSPTGRWDRHYLVWGNRRNAYDRCCKCSLIDLSEAPYQEHSLSRPYLRALQFLQGGEERKVEHDDLLKREAPLYCAGLATGRLVAVDLSAAYWQLYTPTSLDLDYDGLNTPRNGHVRFLGVSELQERKSLRNSLIGTIRAEARVDLDHGLMRKILVPGTLRRPSLWAYIQDMLTAVAWEMRLNFGAVHIQTDGYLFPHPELAEEASSYLADIWGLESQIRASGEGFVAGLGAWKIEDVEVGKYEMGEPLGEPFDNMGDVPNLVELREWFLDAKAYFVENPAKFA